MCNTSTFPGIMAVALTLWYFLSLVYFSSNFSLHIKQIFAFSYDSYCSFVKNLIFFFLKLIIIIACSFKDLQVFFMQALPIYALSLFSILLNDDIVDMKKPDQTCSPTFAVHEFSGLFLYPSIFCIKHSTICIK